MKYEYWIIGLVLVGAVLLAKSNIASLQGRVNALEQQMEISDGI